MPFDADDLSAFVDADMPSHVSALLGAQPLDGLLRERPQEVFGIVGGNAPRFICKASDLPPDPRVVTLTVGARVFNVRDWSTDGTGLATLQLEAA